MIDSEHGRGTQTLTCRFGSPLEYRVTGSGPPLVLASAYGVSIDIWTALAELLSGQFTVVAWAMRGFRPGETDLKLTVNDHADDLREILDHAGLETASILGWCSGSKVVADFYGRYSERVTSLSFLGANFAPLPGGEGLICKFQQNLVQVLQLVAHRPELAAVVVQTLSGGGEDPLVSEIMSLIEPSHRGFVLAPFANEAAVLNYARMVLEYYERDVTSILRGLSVPTLVLVLDQDSVVDPALSRLAAERMESARVRSLPDAGHFCMLVNPEQLASELTQFLTAGGQ